MVKTIIFVAVVAATFVYVVYRYRNSSVAGATIEQHPERVPLLPVPKWKSAEPMYVKSPLFLYRLHSFLSAPECAHIIQQCKEFNPSMVVDDHTGENKKDHVRTSKSCMLTRSQTKIIKTIENRTADVFGVPVENIEPLQVVRYYPGEKFDLHHDYFKHVSGPEGQRYATILVYLNDTFSGGHTNFPKIGVSAKPVLGDGFAWYNSWINNQGKCMCFDDSLHQGSPPTLGVKYALNIWIRY